MDLGSLALSAIGGRAALGHSGNRGLPSLSRFCALRIALGSISSHESRSRRPFSLSRGLDCFPPNPQPHFSPYACLTRIRRSFCLLAPLDHPQCRATSPLHSRALQFSLRTLVRQQRNLR